MTTSHEAAFVDSNVLVYADLISSPFHVPARNTLLENFSRGHPLWISRQVIREYLAVVTRAQSFSLPVPPTDAADSAARIMHQFHIANDTGEVADRLFDLIKRFDVKGKQIHDANIVATMLAHDVKRLLTFNDADFKRYRGIIEILPLMGQL